MNVILNSWINYNIRHFCFKTSNERHLREAVNNSMMTPPLLRPPKVERDSSILRQDRRNHCAHFVSYVLGLDYHDFSMFGVRVFAHTKVDMYASLCRRGFREIENISLFLNETEGLKLIYVVDERRSVRYNQGRIHIRRPNRHIGFYENGYVWHYDNELYRVICHRLESDRRFLARYGDTSVVFVSDLPRIGRSASREATPRSFNQRVRMYYNQYGVRRRMITNFSGRR
jgi:hypothetical protein